MADKIGNITINTTTKIYISYTNYRTKSFSLGVFVKRCLYKKKMLMNVSKKFTCETALKNEYDNRPFATGGHMVQNPKYWRAKECDKTSQV